MNKFLCKNNTLLAYFIFWSSFLLLTVLDYLLIRVIGMDLEVAPGEVYLYPDKILGPLFGALAFSSTLLLLVSSFYIKLTKSKVINAFLAVVFFLLQVISNYIIYIFFIIIYFQYILGRSLDGVLYQ
ncbi:hypothetical protein Pan241w_41470 [Gimesia alba]|uniref:Uncharacterized protein n=1 Tax=Gimesia alba TaxID=2527973 RepID=A0A517RJL7_9PLAN|nr:hypothetical protein Pan241w_41470 [Gimesia alba]